MPGCTGLLWLLRTSVRKKRRVKSGEVVVKQALFERMSYVASTGNELKGSGSEPPLIYGGVSQYVRWTDNGVEQWERFIRRADGFKRYPEIQEQHFLDATTNRPVGSFLTKRYNRVAHPSWRAG